MAEILKLEIDTNSVIKETALLAKQLEKAKVELKGIEEASGKTSEEYVKQEAEVKALNKEYRTNSTLLTNLNATNKGNITTIKEARAALSAVSVEWAKSAKLYGENDAATQKLSDQKKELTDLISKEEKLTGDARRGVAKYSDGIKEAFKDGLSFSGSLEMVGGSSSIATKGMDILKGGVGNLGTAFKALIANPIVLLFVAIIAAVKGLYDQFKSTKEGGDLIEKSFAAISSAIEFLKSNVDKIIDVFISYYKIAFKLLTLDFKGVGEEFTNMKNTVKELGVGMADAAKEGYKLAALQNVIRDLKQEVRETNIALGDQATAYDKIRNDSTKSFKDREDAERGFAETTEKIYQNNLSIAQKEFELADRKYQQDVKNNKYNEENINNRLTGMEKLSDAETALVSLKYDSEQRLRALEQQANQKKLDVLNDSFNNTKTINAQIYNSDKETIDNRQKVLEQTIKIGRETFDKQIETIQSITTETIDSNDLVRESNATILAEKIRALGLSEVYETRLLQAIKERQKTEAEAAKAQIGINDAIVANIMKSAELELEVQRTNLNNKLEMTKAFSDQEYTLLLQKLDMDYTAEVENAERIGADTSIIKAKYVQYEKDLDDERKLFKLENELVALEESYAQDAVRADWDFKTSQERLTAKWELERSIAVAKNEDITNIDRMYAEQQKNIDKQKTDFKIMLAQGALGNIATIFGQESKLGQAAAASNALIDGTKGAISAYSSLAGIPIVGPALGAVAAIAVGVKTASAVKKIYATKPGSKGGGSINMSGTSGSGGGVADGGNVASQQQQFIDNSNASVKQSFSDALKENPSVLVIEEVNRVNTQRNTIIEQSQI